MSEVKCCSFCAVSVLFFFSFEIILICNAGQVQILYQLSSVSKYWMQCASFQADLPERGWFAVTAATGGLSGKPLTDFSIFFFNFFFFWKYLIDNHDVLSFETFKLETGAKQNERQQEQQQQEQQQQQQQQQQQEQQC